MGAEVGPDFFCFVGIFKSRVLVIIFVDFIVGPKTNSNAFSHICIYIFCLLPFDVFTYYRFLSLKSDPRPTESQVSCHFYY